MAWQKIIIGDLKKFDLLIFGAERFGIFAGMGPAIRCNLVSRTPAHKDFIFTRAKRTGEAIGAKRRDFAFLP